MGVEDDRFHGSNRPFERDSHVTRWIEELADARVKANDEEGPVVLSLPESDWYVHFDAGWGGSEGPPVLAWTERRVYFPVVYDGAEWLESAPRFSGDRKGQYHVSWKNQSRSAIA